MILNYGLSGESESLKSLDDKGVFEYREISPPNYTALLQCSHPPQNNVLFNPFLVFCSFTLSSPLVVIPGLSQEKVATFVERLQAEPRYLLAQNVSTCIDPLEVCLHRKTVQDTVHIFQHAIPTEGKPVTNQKNSGSLFYSIVFLSGFLFSSDR